METNVVSCKSFLDADVTCSMFSLSPVQWPGLANCVDLEGLLNDLSVLIGWELTLATSLDNNLLDLIH